MNQAPPLDVAWFATHDFWSKAMPDENGCMIWHQSTGSHQYGQTWDGVTVRLAHRVAWVLHHGEQIHPYDEANTRRDGRGHRRCLACQNERNAKRGPRRRHLI